MKVLVGSVGTPEGQAAVDFAKQEVLAKGGELHLVVHVPPPANEREAQEHGRLLEHERERIAAEADLIATSEGLSCQPHFLQGPGRSSHALLHLAEELDVDRIVVGTRRRSAVGKLLLGSTAQDIILAAHCPVISVKAAEDA